MQSQNKQILEYLQTGKGITPIEALEKFQCFRLSGRIYDLKDAGHDIVTKIVEKEGKRFAKYFLVTPELNAKLKS